jgi:hypothetical protein
LNAICPRQTLWILLILSHPSARLEITERRFQEIQLFIFYPWNEDR